MYCHEGKGIAPLYGLDIKPLQEEEITSENLRCSAAQGYAIIQLSAFWCYEGHVSTCYSLELLAEDFPSWWQDWLNEPEKLMREQFCDAQRRGWSWKPLQAAQPSAKKSLGGTIRIDLDTLFG